MLCESSCIQYIGTSIIWVHYKFITITVHSTYGLKNNLIYKLIILTIYDMIIISYDRIDLNIQSVNIKIIFSIFYLNLKTVWWNLLFWKNNVYKAFSLRIL